MAEAQCLEGEREEREEMGELRVSRLDGVLSPAEKFGHCSWSWFKGLVLNKK